MKKNSVLWINNRHTDRTLHWEMQIQEVKCKLKKYQDKHIYLLKIFTHSTGVSMSRSCLPCSTQIVINFCSHGCWQQQISDQSSCPFNQVTSMQSVRSQEQGSSLVWVDIYEDFQIQICKNKAIFKASLPYCFKVICLKGFSVVSVSFTLFATLVLVLNVWWVLLGLDLL